MSQDYHEPALIGREDDLETLKGYLEDCLDGRGTTVLISGEAGIGKTRLLEELKNTAKLKKFWILSGNCVYEYLTPFMPFKEALKSESLEVLLEEKSPRVESAYLVTKSGLLIKEQLREETDLDSDIFSSMLTTIENFLKESLSIMMGSEKEGNLSILGYENYRILIEGGRNVNLAVIITEKENEFLINDMREIILSVEEAYGDDLEHWKGGMKEMAGIDRYLLPLFTSGKYDGERFEKGDLKVRRDLIFENVIMGLQRFTESSPALLCLDDLHWADPSSLALLHYVARNMKNRNMLIVGTYRPEEVLTNDTSDHPLIRSMDLMDREELYKKMPLQRLPESCLTGFLDSMLEKNEFSDGFRDLIYQETEGNPLFIIELIKLLMEEKIIENIGGIWREAKDLSKIEMPSKVYNVIVRRLNQLDKEDRKVLDYASIIGETFTSSILTETLKLTKVELLERLRTIEKSHRLIHANNGDFRFDHAKTKEVLYNEIPGELRREYHLIIANGLETLHKNDLDTVIYELVQHYYLGCNHNRSLYYSMMAGQSALAGFAPERAMEFYKRALDSIDQLKGEDGGNGPQHTKRSWILLKLYETCKFIGEWDKALKYTIDLLEHCEKIGDKKKQTDALINKAELHFLRSQWAEAVEHYNQALKIAVDLKYKHGLMKSYHGLGKVNVKIGDFSSALDYSQQFLDLASSMGLDVEIARAYRLFGVIITHKGDSRSGLNYFEKCVKLLSETDKYSELAMTYTDIGISYFEMGKFDKVIEQNEKVIEITSKIGDIRIKGYGYSNSAEAYARLNNLDKAIEYNNIALEIFSRIGEMPMLGLVYMNFGIIYKKKLDWKTSSNYFEKSISILRKHNVPLYLADSLYQFGLMLQRQNAPESNIKSQKYFQKSLEIFKGLNAEKYINIIQKELNKFTKNK